VRPLHTSKLLVILGWLGFWPGWLLAQNTLPASDTLRVITGDSLRLSQGFLVPYSEEVFTLSGQAVSRANYEIQYAGGWIRFRAFSPQDSFAVVRYRYFRSGLAPEISLRQIRIVRDTATQEEQVDVIYDESLQGKNREFLASDRIRKSGSLTRGIGVGNNQGLSVTSGLRLQLEGDLGDGLKIQGAITDENIPIQPDGTTQQISDFDKVFIKLSRERFSLTMGDYEVQQKSSRFGNFYRNVQGVRMDYQTEKGQVSVSGAVAKGKFHTNTLTAIEGVAGPYRLSGKNGERFFIVLAGSEKVYLNGQLMIRGINQDYIINYNTAEITFMPKHVITNITRIVVDFEYNDQYYNRSLTVARLNQKLFQDRLDVAFSYARDADNANAPFDNRDAFQSVRDSLRLVGDDPDQAITSGIDTLQENDPRPPYSRRDTLINGTWYERYVFAPFDSLETTQYALFCSNVGRGNGFYRLDPSIQGATVYEWVPPDSLGNPQGTHAPIRRWVLPKLLQVANARLDLKLTENISLFNETAISSNDDNRLSNLDEQDNIGLAQRSGIRIQNLKVADSLKLNAEVFHQFVDTRYTNLDRIYQAEYNRVWDLDPDEERADEQIVGGRVRLAYEPGLNFLAQGGWRNTGKGQNAYRQVYRLESSLNKMLQGFYQFTHIQNQLSQSGRQSQWTRHEGDIYLPLGKLRLGTVLWLENKNDQRLDTIRNQAFAFVDLKPYLRTVETRQFQLEAYWNYRRDQALLNGELRDKTQAYTWFVQGRYRPSPAFQVQSTTSYRVLNVLDSLFRDNGLENSRVLNTNLQGSVSPKKRWFYLNFVYDVSSEQLAQQEVFFVEVNPGQGNYVWLDSLYNNDGIQDVAEFQLATIPEIANFIRVIRPTRELFPTTRLSMNGLMRWNLAGLVPADSGALRKLVRGISTTTSLKAIQNKGRNTALASYFLNLADPFADTTLLNANLSFQQDLNFFQKNPRGDLRFTYFSNQNKLFLNTGDEFRALEFFRATQRLNFNESRSLEVESRLGRKSLSSAGFPQRNYAIQFWETNPQLNFQFNQKVRFSGGYQYQSRFNTNISGETDSRVQTHKLIFDGRVNLKDRNNVFGKLELASVQEEGSTTTAAQFELREGLQPGFNAVWRLTLVVYVLENVELSLNYDGRASVKSSTLHSGRVQVRAFF
jgi:hypothetical protein